MPSPTLDEACAALASAVATIPGLRAKGYADDQINPPEAQVYTRPFDPRMVFGRGNSYGPSTYLLGVRVFVKRADMRSAQKSLRDFMETTGTSSVVAAVEDSDNWDATVDDVEVTSIGQPFEVDISGEGGAVTLYWAVDFDVDVIW